MRSVLRFVPIVLTATAFASTQEAINLERLWRVGSVETQRVGISFSMAMGDVDVSMITRHKVLKLHEGDEAEVETSVSQMKVFMNNQEVNAPGGSTPPVITQRICKSGMPVNRVSASGTGIGLDFIRYAFVVSDKPLRVGESTTIDYKSAGDAGSKVAGTLKLDSIENGIAKLICNYEVSTQNTSEKPMRMSVVNWLRLSDKTFIKSEGTFSNLPAFQGLQVPAAQFAMELIEN
ncbi:MAG: hypothetical protein KIT74_10515 [Fimbriimonadales bacterium]|nr:hypothetical protein [Fimbriimonadales bacterium]